MLCDGARCQCLHGLCRQAQFSGFDIQKQRRAVTLLLTLLLLQSRQQMSQPPSHFNFITSYGPTWQSAPFCTLPLNKCERQRTTWCAGNMFSQTFEVCRLIPAGEVGIDTGLKGEFAICLNLKCVLQRRLCGRIVYNPLLSVEWIESPAKSSRNNSLIQFSGTCICSFNCSRHHFPATPQCEMQI